MEANPHITQALQTWVDQQIAAGARRQELCHKLLNGSAIDKCFLALDGKLRDDTFQIKLAGNEAEARLSRVMVDRNMRGLEFEKSGDVDSAIREYELNVMDDFAGTHPYTRLRILYIKRGDYLNAVRICDRFLSLCLGHEKDRRLVAAQRGKYARKAPSQAPVALRAIAG